MTHTSSALPAVVTAAACLTGMAACDSSTDADVGGDDYAVVALDLLPKEVVDVDVLFVVDNSGSMQKEQLQLVDLAKEALFDTLMFAGDAPLSLHIGVVSTDVGAGGMPISGCDQMDTAGLMQNTPRTGECSGPTGRFIIDIDNGDGTRTINYSGAIEDAFGCIVQLGTDGCGHEQPLEAMKRALDGSQPENAGFLRDDALLAVVIMSDEDDCSASGPTIFDPNDINGLLGPLTSFRCFDFGVTCAEDDLRSPGIKTNCTAREDSPYIRPVSMYAEFLNSLKADPSMVVVSGVFGNADAATNVITDPTYGLSELLSACPPELGTATPGVRLGTFLDLVPARSRFATICDGDLTDSLTAAARRISDTANRTPCLEGALVTGTAEPRCRVVERTAAADTAIAHCDDAGPPCYRLRRDVAMCGHTPTALALDLARDGQAPPAGSRVVVQCATQ